MKATGDTDWYALAAFICKYAPGFGDPLDMPLDRLIATADAVSAMVKREADAMNSGIG